MDYTRLLGNCVVYCTGTAYGTCLSFLCGYFPALGILRMRYQVLYHFQGFFKLQLCLIISQRRRENYDKLISTTLFHSKNLQLTKNVFGTYKLLNFVMSQNVSHHQSKPIFFRIPGSPICQHFLFDRFIQFSQMQNTLSSRHCVAQINLKLF